MARRVVTVVTMAIFKIFLSHTSDMAGFPADRSFVQAALDAVGRAGLVAVDMRYFPAGDVSPAEYCRERVRNCHIYVAIVGFRYGSMVEADGVSYTELEFREAGRASLPRLVFLLEESACPPELADADRGLIDGFRRRLSEGGLVVRAFRSGEGLELEVFHALTESVRAIGPSRLSVDSQAGRLAGVVSGAHWRRQLPAGTGAFTGRERELRQLTELARRTPEMAAEGAVLTSVIGGMGGIGKTALALRAAHHLAGRFPDGQLFIDLRGYTAGLEPLSPGTALEWLLQSLGVPVSQIPPGAEARAALYRHRLADTETLIILDNASSTSQVRHLLPGAGRCMVLITSRRRLAGLDDACAVDLGVLDEIDAVSLFHKVAGSGRIQANHPAVREIVDLCGHLPLAIRIVAARLRFNETPQVEELAAQLRGERDRLARLRDEGRDLTAAFSLSYQHLPAAEQSLFRLLGLVPGSDFDCYAAASLLSSDFAVAEQLLESLIDHNLLNQRTPGRFSLHDLVRVYARGLTAGALADAEVSARSDSDTVIGDSAADRLLNYYQRCAQAANRHIGGSWPDETIPAIPAGSSMPEITSPEAAAAWMEAEHFNVHAIADHALADGRPAQVISIRHSMNAFLRARGYWEEALALDRLALTATHDLADQRASADVLNDMGDVQKLTGDYATAIRTLELALGLYRQHGERPGEATALSRLGVVHSLIDDYSAAADTLTRALRIYRDLADLRGEAFVLTRLGAIQRVVGDYPAALANLARGLETCRSLGDQAGQASAVRQLGATHAVMGSFAEAVACQDEAFRLCSGLGDKLGMANALRQRCIPQYLTGAYADAADSLTNALALYREIGDRLGEANSQNNFGVVHHLTGQYPAAVNCLTQALELYHAIGNRNGAAEALGNLGATHLATGDLPAAAASLQQALTLHRSIGRKNGQIDVLNSLGELSMALEEPQNAQARYEEALALARQLTDPPGEARALKGIGQCHLHHQRRGEGESFLRQALEIYDRIGSPMAEDVRKIIADTNSDQLGRPGS